MINLTGFRIDNILYESEQTIVQQAIDIQNNTSVVLKCAKRENLTPVRRIRFMKDYQVSKSLQADCVIQPIHFLDRSDALISVYPETGCMSLNQAIRSKLCQTDELLRLFYLSADALAQVHSEKWVHMNLSLDHILTDATFFKIFIIDWQSAIQLDGLTISRPPFVNKTPEIIPPELTGYTNDVVDERTDLYALGCIFYELFTSSPVFREKDPLRQIQSHIMCQPVPPHEGYDPYVPVAQHVPESISQMLMKLLAKDPSQRYESAHHLTSDLYKCLTDKSFISNFDPSKKVPSHIHMKSHLYERNEEIEKIHVIYNSYAQQPFSDGISTLLLISGKSGTGKSALCKTLIPHVFDKNGYWFCDSFYCTPDLPLGVFARMLSHLLKLMQTSFPNELENQIKQLVYKGLICPDFLRELIPELIPLSGHLFPSAQYQSQSQLVSAKPFLLALFHLLGQKFQPMILCLENLQWADTESLMLLESLICDRRQSFFVVTTCHSEQSPPIQALTTNSQKQGVNVYSVETHPLSKPAVNQCILDIFQCPTDQAEHLSEMIYDKTDGNPRAVRMTLDRLFSQKEIMLTKGGLAFNFSPTLSLPEFNHSKLSFFNESERFVFQKIACIGQQWSMTLACQITGLPALEMEKLIQKAFKQGVIAPTISFDSQYDSKQNHDMWIFSDESLYHFLYFDLPKKKQKDIHKKISQQLSLSMSKKVDNASLYMIAGHLNRTQPDNNLKIDQARTYISAGERALISGLFLTAYDFFDGGISLFSETDGENHQQILFDLYLNALIAANSCALDNEIPLIIEQLSRKTSSNLEKLKYYECLASVYSRQNQHEKVFETVRKGLSVVKLQINVPAIYRQWAILRTGLKYRHLQKKNPRQQISDKDLKHNIS